MLLRSVRQSFVKKGAIGRWRMLGGRVIVTGGAGDSHVVSGGGDLSVWRDGLVWGGLPRRGGGGAIRGGI
jgi:hypothetical protein